MSQESARPRGVESGYLKGLGQIKSFAVRLARNGTKEIQRSYVRKSKRKANKV